VVAVVQAVVEVGLGSIRVDIFLKKKATRQIHPVALIYLASPMDLSWNQVEGWLKELVLIQNGVVA
jgi:hypothetical protein